MEETKEMGIEPVTKKMKLDPHLHEPVSNVDLSLSPTSSSAIVGNGNGILPCLENDDELQRVLELDNSSSSESDESIDEEEEDFEVKNSESIESKDNSLSPEFEELVDDLPGTSKPSESLVKRNQDRKRKRTKRDEPDKSNIKLVKTMRNSSKRKAANLRKNIKDILKTEHLGEETLAAQREEAERRQRMNLKLQAQQQQLKLLHQQQAQFMRETGFDASDNGYSKLSIDEIVKKIAQKKHITVSLEPEGGNVVINEPHGQAATAHRSASEEIVLSSDDEGDSHINLGADEIMYHPDLSHWPMQSNNHFGGTVTAPVEDNIISISSGEEDERDELCDREVESLGRPRNNLNPTAPVQVESDDDCVVISPTPDENEADKDERNQDELNVLDEFGRVLVNLGHPQEDPDIFLAPQVARMVKPHQIGGIRFLYDNVVESVERFNGTSGFGCILAHSMGLGKTIQAVSFCDVFLRAGAAKTILVIVPINTIQNWLNEFNVWLPPRGTLNKKKNKWQKNPKIKLNSSKSDCNSHQSSSQSSISDSVSETVSLNLSFDSTLNLNCAINDDSNQNRKTEGSPRPEETSETEVDLGEIHARSFEVFVLNETVKTLPAREKIINDWSTKGGVLLIGYEMYRMLALKKLKRSTRKQPSYFNEDTKEGESDTLNQIYSRIVDPGPDLVICDEGHRIKNSGASISQALKAIRTKRRVVLTGYPLQNNLMEYWCMVDFIRPNYLGSKVDFSNMFERPISNGQCVDSTPEDRRLMKFRSHVLHSLLEGFVQRRSHAVLQNALPQKQEWVFLLKMTPIQYKLYKAFIKYLSENVEGQSAANPIKAFAVCCKIWNHPDALYNVVKKKQSILDDLDLDEINATEPTKGKRGPKAKKDSPAPISYFDGSGFNFPRSHYGSYGSASSSRSGSEALSLDWAIPIFENYVPGVLENGVKFEILFEIIKETVAAGDKLLVFSQTLLSLDLTEIFLAQKFQWAKNFQYYRLDGGTTGLEREKLINNFNAKPEVFVFLVSTRAGSLGINLTGANRVVVLDASWNPCHDCQAVCRIYRYGQTKPCQIYRFVSDCTLEKRIYDRQINKRGMSDRVVDEMNPNAQFKTKDVSSFLVLKHEHLDKLPFIKWDLHPEKYSDPILQNVLLRVGQKLTQAPFEHESLLIDQKSQRLSATEKRLALRNYINEKRSAELQSASGFTHSRPSYSAYYPKETSQSQPSRPYGNPLTNYKQFQLTNEDKFEQHVPALRLKGICVQSIVLKKDSFLADPGGGPDMFLMAGEKVYVLRSVKGTYLRLSNGKLIAVRNSPSNNRIPGMMVPASQDLSKEQLQGLVYSFLKLPGQHQFGNESYSDSSSYPPTEQPLPPSPSFFSQNKNHLQVTNARNTSGGDVTLWQPLGEGSSEPEKCNGAGGNSSRSHDQSPYKSISKALAETSSASPFNPNLERLSYLANRFPGFSQNPDLPFQHREQFNHGMSSSLESSGHQFLSSSTSFKSNSINGSNSTERAEMELIPIKKSNSGNGRSSTNRIENSILPRTQKLIEPSVNPRPVFDFSASSFNNYSKSNPPPQKLLDVNPSFYKDFTITVKSSTASNGSSSSESFNNSPVPSSTRTAETYQSSSWLNKVVASDNAMHVSDTGVDMGTGSSLQNAIPTCSDTLFSNHNRTGDYFSQFNPKVNQETDFGGTDFRNLSQYYSDNMSSLSGNDNTLEDGETETGRHEVVPVYFPNQGT